MTASVTDDEVRQLYRATTTPRLVRVPRLSFLSVDGQGDPERGADYAGAVQALFAVAYTVKFAVVRAGGDAFKVSYLEGLWWADDPAAFLEDDRSRWRWRMLVRQPEPVTKELVRAGVDQVAARKDLPAFLRPELVSLEEGPAAQVMHVGPYDAEAATISRLHGFLRERGLAFDGLRHKHHEIYLGDPRRSAPERLRTIIRQPYVEA